MLSFSDLSDRHAQLRQVVGRLAVKTIVCHPAELVRDPICHIEPVQLIVKELCQTAVVLPCAAYSVFKPACSESVSTAQRYVAGRASGIKYNGVRGWAYSCSHLCGCCRLASGNTVRGVSERGPAINQVPQQNEN